MRLLLACLQEARSGQLLLCSVGEFSYGPLCNLNPFLLAHFWHATVRYFYRNIICSIFTFFPTVYFYRNIICSVFRYFLPYRILLP